MSWAQGNHLELSAITATLHLGAHADAPSHYDPRGASMEAVSLETYLGPCQVVRVAVARGERVRPAHLKVPISAPRVLFHTGTFPNPDAWNSDFAALSLELIDHLADQGVRLVGLDTPSVDPEDDKLLPSHHALARRGMAVLEGLVLSEVPEGIYTLVALPLRLVGADASPVRAVLY